MMVDDSSRSKASESSVAPAESPFPPPLADAEARERALEPGGSFHLEAPAGSGKTYLLTARFLKLLSLVRSPQQILALTFTKKAAREMQERVTTLLGKAARSEPPANELEAARLEDAERALARHRDRLDLMLAGDVLHIQTFHSFCHFLVSQAPLEAGVVPGSQLLDETDQALLVKETIDTTLLEISRRPAGDARRRALENRLLCLNHSWPGVVGDLRNLLLRRELISDLTSIVSLEQAEDYVLQGYRELAESLLSAAATSFRGTALGAAWPDFVDHLASKKAGAADVLPSKIPGTGWEALSDWQAMASALLTKSGTPRKQLGPKSGYYSGFAKTEWGRAIQTLEGTPAEALMNLRELPLEGSAAPDLASLWDLLLLFTEVLGNYQARLRAQQALDFPGLEIAALRLFEREDPIDLQLFLDERIRHILVDEFQDTSRHQWRLLQHLCRGWQPDDESTLFLVGDPKQSIYGFRRAEVGLFMEARRGLPVEGAGRLPMEPLTICTNFRSGPHLIQWCNALFGQTVMRDPRLEVDEVPFTEAAPPPFSKSMEEESPELPETAELVLFSCNGDRASARQSEAAWLASAVRRELEQRGPERRIGVLLFVRTSLPVYLEEMQRYGVRVRVEQGLKLTERPEVNYLYQLARALVLPQDDTAWAAQIRSPWLCLDYDDLLAVGKETPRPWVEKIRLAAERDERLAHLREAMREAGKRFGRRHLADVVEQAWLDLDGARAVGAWQGSRGIAGCRRFLDLLRQAEAGEPVQTLERLEILLESGYEPPDPDAAFSPVQIMTVHKAKGLEFDTVFLPSVDWDPLGNERGSQPPYVLERLSGGEGRPLLAVRPDRRFADGDPLYAMLRKVQHQRRIGEAKRLFYVATTRARQRLLLSGVLPEKGVRGATPAGWVFDHYSLDWSTDEGPSVSTAEEQRAGKFGFDGESLGGSQSPESGFQATLDPAIPPPPPDSMDDSKPGPEYRPAGFERERPAFRVARPSDEDRVAGEDAEAETLPAETAAFDPGRVYGETVHRLLQTGAREGRMPSAGAVAGFLQSKGADKETAARLADAALGEVRACLEDPWLSGIYREAGEDLRVEHRLEEVDEGDKILAGTVDLAAKVDEGWILVDFKTGQPQEPAGPEELEIFRRDRLSAAEPQLRAYRRMWAKHVRVPENTVRVGIYLTGIRCWLELSD
jgi:ATP-dependent exoDNAse (exonuclease V) beta subunit